MRRFRPAAVFGLCAALSSSAGQTYFIGLFGSHLQNEFALSASGLGVLYGIATLAGGLLMFWLGAIVDRIALRTACTIAAATITAGAVTIFTAAHPAQILIAFLLLRLGGQGLMGHIAIVAAARQSGKGRGRSIATASLGFIIGEALWPVLVLAALSSFNWRIVWIATALMMLAVVTPVLRKLSTPLMLEPAPSVKSEPARLSRTQLLSRTEFLAPLCVVITPAIVVTAVFFQQSTLSELRGWTTAELGTAFVVFATGQLLGNVSAGSLIDRMNARIVFRFHLLPLALGVTTFASFDGPAVLWTLFAGLGVSAGANSVVGGALWAEIFGVRQLGLIRGMHAALMIAGTAAAPVLFGLAFSSELALTTVSFAVAAYAVIAPWIASSRLSRALARRGTISNSTEPQA